MVTMSQKSSLLQPARFVSQALTPDIRLQPASPPPAPSAPAANKTDDKQQYKRADGGVENLGDDSGAKMDVEFRQEPASNEGA